MQFSFYEGFHRVVRITGPTHNLLSVKFGDSGKTSVQIIDEPSPDGLSTETVERAVMRGLSKANEELGTNFFPLVVQYLQKDTPSEEAYEILAYHLAIHVNDQSHRQD